MLKKSNTKFSYWRKVFALPLLFMIVFTYMVKAENREIAKSNKIVEEMNNFNTKKSKSDTINPFKNVKNSSLKIDNITKDTITITKDFRAEELIEQKRFPNPMTINLYRSSDENSFFISGKEVSKKEFVDYFVKYNANPDYSFGATSNTYKELETAGKLAIFMAGKNEELKRDSENVFESVKKYSNEKATSPKIEKTDDINISRSTIYPEADNNKYLEFFKSAQKNRAAYYASKKAKSIQMAQEIREANDKISSKSNFYTGRNYDEEPLTKSESENLKKQAENIENIRKKYDLIQEKNGDFMLNFIGFKPGKSTEIVYNISGNKIKENEVQNDKLLMFPVFSQNSEFYIDGKKVSKENILKLSENLFAIKDFFKNPPTIKTMKRKMVANGKENYLMKLELFTK